MEELTPKDLVPKMCMLVQYKMMSLFCKTVNRFLITRYMLCAGVHNFSMWGDRIIKNEL